MDTPDTLFNEIKAGKFKPAYYFFGPEDYRIVEAEKYVAGEFLPDRQLTANYRRLDGKAISLSNLIAELSSLPLLGERQVITVSDIQHYGPKQIEQIIKMLSPPDPNRVVVFTSPSSRTPRKSSAFFKKMDQAVTTVEFRRLTATKVSRNIRIRMKSAKLEIEPKALEILTELISGNRGGLETEIDKLVNFKTSGETVITSDIEAVSSGHEAYNIFELADQIVEGKTRTVVKMIKSLLADGNSPVVIGLLLQQHFLSVYLVKNGKSPLGNRRFLIHKFRGQAARYDNERLEKIIIEIAQADAEFRHQKMKPEQRLEMLALSLVR